MTPRKRPLKEMKSAKIGGKMKKNMNPELLRARLVLSGEGLQKFAGATKRAFSTI